VSAPPIVVQKFGGTSVSTPERRRQVVDHVRREQAGGRRVAVVVSAMGRRGDPYATDTLLDILRSDGGAVDPADYDLMFVCGEMISTALLSQTLKRAGVAACGLSAVQARIFTDGRHLESEVTTIETDRLAALMAGGIVPVVCGGQGVTPGHLDFTTLGRGGSDTSAVALGAALGAERVDIFTDVDGVLTTDPRIVPNARLLGRLSYRSCLELARFGARVVHPRAIACAARTGMPVRVRSTFSPGPGTVIGDVSDDGPVAGIALLPAVRTVSLGAPPIATATPADWECRAPVLILRDASGERWLAGAPPDQAGALADVLASMIEPSRSQPIEVHAWVSAVGDSAVLAARHAESLRVLAGADCPPIAAGVEDARATFVVEASAARRAVAALHRQHFG